MKRIVFLVHMVPRFITDFGALARHLAAQGIPATIYAPTTRSDSAAGWARPDVAAACRAAVPAGIDVRELPFDRERLGIRGLIRTSWLAFSLGRRDRDTIFVLWTIIPILVCGLPLRILRRRCVFLLTGLGSVFGSDRRTFRLIRPIVTLAYSYLFSGPASRVIVHNHEDKKFLTTLGIAPGHIAVTPGCGVDPAEFPYFPELPRAEKKIVLVPVRLMREKGVLDAARASALLTSMGIAHEMWFSSSIDPGNPSSLSAGEIEQIRRESPAARFIGYQPSLVPVYEASTVVCIPTCYREGLPTALLEAAACGRPVVATNNVGCRDFVVDGETGLTVPPGAPTEIAHALIRLFEDRQLADRLRRNAHLRFQEAFTKEAMLASTMQVLASLGLETDRRFDIRQLTRATPPVRVSS